LNKRFNTPISQKIKDIDTYQIEKALNEHQAVEKADVYISIDGKLIIDLTQRKAILRVFSKNKSFYIDNKGKIMPVSEKYTAHVPVATGEINLDLPSLLKFTNLKGELIDSALIPKLYFDLYYLSSFIDSNPFWKAQIEQVYVDKQSEFELIPRVGNHTIVLGGVYNLQQKFDKLMQFYTKGLSKTGWNEYRTINLKYKDQVVCTKRF
jgi:cell division protein FtsQ